MDYTTNRSADETDMQEEVIQKIIDIRSDNLSIPYSQKTAVSIVLPFGCQFFNTTPSYQYYSFEKEYVNTTLLQIYDSCYSTDLTLTMLDDYVIEQLAPFYSNIPPNDNLKIFDQYKKYFVIFSYNTKIYSDLMNAKISFDLLLPESIVIAVGMADESQLGILGKLTKHVVVTDEDPCRRAVILAMDMSSAIGSVDNQTLFNQQKNAVWTAYHLWELSDAAIRVMLPAPNGLGVTDEIFSELHDNIIELDDIMTRIIDADGQAYQPSDLPRQIEYLGSNFDLNYDETVKYILVLFSGTTNQAEIKNATTMYKNIFDEKNIEIIVVTVGPTTADFSQLGSDAVLQLSDPDFYFTLTNEICDGVVENTPTGAPTPVPEPVYPAESDLFIIFSISDCPISSQISSQVTLTKEMLKNFTFQENGIRAAVPTPIGMTFYGNNMLWYSRDMVFSEIDSIKGYSSVSGFCQQGSISDALKNINDNLRIKDNSSAVVLLFVDSADTTDIASSATFRKCSFDPRGVQVVTIELYGSASTVDLATPNLNFKIDDSNLQTEIVNAIINAPSK